MENDANYLNQMIVWIINCHYISSFVGNIQLKYFFLVINLILQLKLLKKYKNIIN